MLLLVVPGILLPGGGRLHAQSGIKTVKIDCAPVLEKMRADIAADPGRLILAVEDALTTNEACACPIIRNAVNLSGRDPALTSQIVVAGVRLAPSAAAGITECALMEAPDSAEAVRAALAKELGDGAVPWLAPAPAPPADTGTAPAAPEPAVDGKGQAPVNQAAAAPADDAESFWPSVGISGIYVIMPSQRGAGAPIAGAVQRVISTRKKLPKRPSSPLTRHIPE
ncbi:MAG: hypothetical protein V4675_05845 [Verrucomicrobiota bacterium]